MANKFDLIWFYITFHIFVVIGVVSYRLQIWYVVWRSQVLAQTLPERGVVRSREPFKFWLAPTISLERLIVSGAVDLGGRSV